MTDNEMRIATAEECGLQQCCMRCEHEQNIALDECVECGASTKTKRTAPDYPNDLNAMHEAEKTLNELSLSDYKNTLACMFGSHEHGGKDAILATAHQRCEAFLRVRSKWKDS